MEPLKGDHRMAARVVAKRGAAAHRFVAGTNLDELIPGYPMPHWQRGKYDRSKKKQAMRTQTSRVLTLTKALNQLPRFLKRAAKPMAANLHFKGSTN